MRTVIDRALAGTSVHVWASGSGPVKISRVRHICEMTRQGHGEGIAVQVRTMDQIRLGNRIE